PRPPRPPARSPPRRPWWDRSPPCRRPLRRDDPDRAWHRSRSNPPRTGAPRATSGTGGVGSAWWDVGGCYDFGLPLGEFSAAGSESTTLLSVTSDSADGSAMFPSLSSYTTRFPDVSTSTTMLPVSVAGSKTTLTPSSDGGRSATGGVLPGAEDTSGRE